MPDTAAADILRDPSSPSEHRAAEALHDGYQLTEKDRKQLAMPDSEFHVQSWDGLREIIRSNRLEDMTRVPSDLRRYIAWSHATRKAYGSIQSYILATRLHWTLPLTPVNPIPFADSADTRILINDWPYGLVPGIVHLVCWTKCVIPTILPGEPGEGDLTPQARLVIQDWVDDTFAERLGAENVLWFKNWASIQSVRSVEHIHVLLRGATEEFLKEVVDDEPGRVLVGDLERKKEEEEGLL